MSIPEYQLLYITLPLACILFLMGVVEGIYAAWLFIDDKKYKSSIIRKVLSKSNLIKMDNSKDISWIWGTGTIVVGFSALPGIGLIFPLGIIITFLILGFRVLRRKAKETRKESKDK